MSLGRDSLVLPLNSNLLLHSTSFCDIDLLGCPELNVGVSRVTYVYCFILIIQLYTERKEGEDWKSTVVSSFVFFCV